jgi:CRP/FNR family transcriptional regulator, cyclic AMP receptor protein
LSPGRFSAFFAYPTEEDTSGDLVFLPDRAEEDWERLLAHAETLRLTAGDVVIRAGELDRALYIVGSGRLEVLLRNERGEERRVAIIPPRSVLGELAFLDARPRSATIRALTDGELMRLTFDSYEILAARYPELGRAIVLDLGRIVASRLRDANVALAEATR